MSECLFRNDGSEALRQRSEQPCYSHLSFANAISNAREAREIMRIFLDETANTPMGALSKIDTILPYMDCYRKQQPEIEMLYY